MKQDTIEIEILPDGTIKTSTDKVSGANHANATAFLRDIATIAGGPTTTRRKGATFNQATISQQQKANQ